MHEQLKCLLVYLLYCSLQYAESLKAWSFLGLLEFWGSGAVAHFAWLVIPPLPLDR